MRARLCLALALVAILGPIRAQAAAAETCDDANLLARALPMGRLDVVGDVSRVTDGVEAAPGALWNAPLAVVMAGAAASLTYDFGAPRTVSAFYLQADNNDSYRLFGSLDAVEWQPLGQVDAVDGEGLRGRTLTIAPALIRYLRIGEPAGDGSYSLAELQAFCRAPSVFPPKLPQRMAPRAAAAPLPLWRDETSARWELALACAGLLLIGLAVRRARRDEQRHLQGQRRATRLALGLLGVLSFGAYFNYGSFHFGGYIHYWDTFHYYIGAKYFSELSYENLYDCVSVAEAEDPLYRRRVELRKLRDLRTNLLVGTADLLAHPERCTERFSPERWREFKDDVAYFRRQQSPSGWNGVLSDHGYNATPVWTLLGATLANLAPLSDASLKPLVWIDFALFSAMTFLIGWAFGWRVLCVALLVLASNFPSRFYWTGGSFLRWDWLFYLVAGICLLRRNSPFAAGMCLAYSSLLRIFPIFVFAGPLFALLQTLWERRQARRAGAPPPPVDTRYLRLFAGAALATLVLVPLSLSRTGGVPTMAAFARNTAKHAATPLTNYMGWKTVVSYRPDEIGRNLRSSKLEDPWQRWKEARCRTFHARAWLYALGILAWLFLLARAVRGREPWVAAALGTSLIAVVPELTCYYYAFLVVPALLVAREWRAGAILLGVTAFGGLVAWAPTQSLPWRLLHLLPTWDDERYTLISVATLVGLGAILWLFAQRREPEPASAIL